MYIDEIKAGNNEPVDLHDKRIPDFDNNPTENSQNLLRSGAIYNALLTKYVKPAAGIPAADLASDVIPDVSNFTTISVNNLLNYYLKSETYTKTEVDNLVNAISQFTYEVVTTLPTASVSTMNKIYLVPNTTQPNIKEEYITVYDGSTYDWTLIGNTNVDLTDYSTTTEMNNAIDIAVTGLSNNVYTKAQIDAQNNIQNQDINTLLNRIVLISDTDYAQLEENDLVDSTKIYMVYEGEE